MTEVRMSVVIDAPRADVSRAWTDPDELVMQPPADAQPLVVAGEYRVILVHDRFVGSGPLEPYTTGWESGLAKLRARVERA